MADQSIPCSEGDTLNITSMLATSVQKLIECALEMMRDNPSLCTDEVRAQLDDMVDQGISGKSITDFLLVHDQ